jgi:hypothetical protein
MAFGQAAGPPAAARDVARALELLEEAGFSSFKEARHPYGLDQRQAGGKFTRDQCAELIERLEADQVDTVAEDRQAAVDERATQRKADKQAELAATLPDEVLVAELERRQWMCVPPA